MGRKKLTYYSVHTWPNLRYINAAAAAAAAAAATAAAIPHSKIIREIGIRAILNLVSLLPWAGRAHGGTPPETPPVSTRFEH